MHQELAEDPAGREGVKDHLCPDLPENTLTTGLTFRNKSFPRGTAVFHVPRSAKQKLLHVEVLI